MEVLRMSYGKEHCKQSLYFNVEMVEELNREAVRLDRSLSWIVQQAWKLAKHQIAQLPDQRVT
jgi:uncharacterized small protein (TIGR04563 family)